MDLLSANSRATAAFTLEWAGLAGSVACRWGEGLAVGDIGLGEGGAIVRHTCSGEFSQFSLKSFRGDALGVGLLCLGGDPSRLTPRMLTLLSPWKPRENKVSDKVPAKTRAQTRIKDHFDCGLKIVIIVKLKLNKMVNKLD